MVNLMSASRQWATRPNDERFWGLQDLQESMLRQQHACREATTDVKNMTVVDQNGEICLQGDKAPAVLSHWSFGQLSGKCGAPANYLRSLPSRLVIDNLNHGLKQIAADEGKMKLMMKKDVGWTVRALTGPTYARIWNADIVNALTPALECGWMVPPARPAGGDDPRARKATKADIVPGQDNFSLSVKEGDMIAPAGVYAGDRDMFVFLVNPNRIIDDGNLGLMRGVFITNSEVGGSAFKVRTFYLENVCGNHIVWGASNIQEIKIVHRKNAIINFDGRTLEQLREYAEDDGRKEERTIIAARKKVIGVDREEVIEKLHGLKSLQLPKRDIEGGFDAACKWEHTALSAPTTYWGMVHGLTRYSQMSKYADERQRIDEAAGKLLSLATVA